MIRCAQCERTIQSGGCDTSVVYLEAPRIGLGLGIALPNPFFIQKIL
jgi:hypothetical protein